MKHTIPDIDIDFANRESAVQLFDCTMASRIKDGKLHPHPTGVYFQSIPADPETGLASLDYQEAEARGWFKIDLLNVGVYEGVKDEAHLNRLLEQEPMWEMLESEEIVDQLFHLNGHWAIVDAMKPRSIGELAMVLAMIRPAKRHLIGKPWDEVEREIWTKPAGDEYYFKKSHALAYAHVLVVQMNLMMEKAFETD